MRKSISFYNLFLLTLMMGCGIKTHNNSEPETAIKVTAERIASFNGSFSTSYSGVIEEKKNTHLSFLTTGTISAILVHEGQQIKKGHLVATMEAASATNAYKIALAQEQKAQDAYERIKPMYENGTLPPIKMVDAETGLNQAIANTAIAKKNAEDNNLYAPSSGTIGKIHLTSGMNTGPGTPVLDILDITRVYIKIPVPEDEISKFRRGINASVFIPAISKNLLGEVKEIGVVADLLSHTYPLLIQVDNSDLVARPGMVGSVIISSESDKTGLLIPSIALQEDINGSQFVYVLDEKNRAEKKLVRTISLMQDKVLVEGEINESDLIVVSGQQKLKPQMIVEIVK
jgi:membrane fusion protein (multidrug efflux system)